ncbi:hypothetical protein [Arthrobacter sp. MDT1-65]
MKKSLSWRLFVLVAGTLFGLLAGMGLSAPAVASPVQVATSGYDRDNGADLTLYVDDGRLRVAGDDYDGEKVYVKVVQIKHNGKQEKVDERYVWPDRGGNFDYRVRNADCDRSYQAYSKSEKESRYNNDKNGWEKSERIWFDCDDGYGGRH